MYFFPLMNENESSASAPQSAWFGLFYSSPYLENLLPEILSACSQASSTFPISLWDLWRGKEKKTKNQTGWG